MFRSLWRCRAPVAVLCGVGFGATTTHASELKQGPADTLVVCGVTTVTTAPSYTAIGCGFNNSGATYDLASGRFSVGAIGRAPEVALSAEDIFTISGPSSTGPVPFSAQLALHLGIEWYAYATVRIGSGDQAQEFATPQISTPGGVLYRTLTLPLSHSAGDHFHLALYLHAVSPARRMEGQATASATLTFVLPPDHVVTSSQGYSSVPTATSATTWGRLKTIYR